MTNQEYEAACIAAAGCYDRFEGEHKLKQIDGHIATLEAALAKAQEARRETVNFYNINKCEHVCINHEWTEVPNVTSDGHHWMCLICRKRVPGDAVMRAVDKQGVYPKEVYHDHQSN